MPGRAVALRLAQRLRQVPLLEKEDREHAVAGHAREGVPVGVVDVGEPGEDPPGAGEIPVAQAPVALEAQVVAHVPDLTVAEVLLDQLVLDQVLVGPVPEQVVIHELRLAVDEEVHEVPLADQRPRDRPCESIPLASSD